MGAGVQQARHHRRVINDFARQPLLPRRLSRTGPGVAWLDLDGDGDDDLVIGSGRGGATGVLVNNGNGTFTSRGSGVAVSDRDETGIVAWSDAPGASTLLKGMSNFEDGRTDGEGVAREATTNGTLTALPGVPATASSTGPLAMADVDGDGDLDLFVGGRTVPGRYPEPASSLMLRNENGQFVVDAASSDTLAKIGLVSGAVFSDIDGDGDPDLVLAREWGPVTVLRNDGGSFVDATEKLGLSALSGWWNGVAAGDFDGDGRIDLVATNWGLNSSYRADSDRPAAIYYGLSDANGAPIPVEAYRDSATTPWLPVRRYADVSKAVPLVMSRFPTFESYGSATLADIYGTGLERGPAAIATTLATTVFLNRGDHFDPVALPVTAQLAPAFGVSVGDLDGDGNEDIVLAQNFFASDVSTPRCDAGRGLWLKGDGRGAFTAVDASASGIRVYGDARGLALADYDGDGRVDLVVGQNGAATRLFHNVRSTPGLRVRLAGPSGNATAAGAAIRPVWGDRMGPLREIHAGSGYLSQDSSVEIFAGETAPTALWIRWPGGAETKSQVPAGAKEIVVSTTGDVRVVR